MCDEQNNEDTQQPDSEPELPPQSHNEEPIGKGFGRDNDSGNQAQDDD